MLYLWLKAFHLIGAVCWFAGLFYLPRLFVYHAMTEAQDHIGRERFKVMERKLYRGIMTPAMIITLVCGIGMIWLVPGLMASGWLHIKLTLLVGLIGYHHWCGKLRKDFEKDQNTHSHVWYRWFNEAPVLVLIAVICLAVIKPF